MIRLAVRCSPEQAERALAELAVLAPNGLEEERGDGYVEYAIYGAEGELPDLGRVEAAAGASLVDVDTGEDGDASGALSDLGTGWGVLAIAAAKLGGDPVLACDHEPAALEAAAE